MSTPKEKIYLIFDKLPKKIEGGLVATYARFVKEFSKDYEIEIVEAFNSGPTDLEELADTKKTYLSPINIDNRFYLALSKLMQRNFGGFFWALFSAAHFFTFIPFAKMKTRRMLKDSIIIASSPAASMFLSSKLKYILEIHTDFEYFWGKNLLGRLQSSLIPTPALTLFRNKTDSEKGSALFTSSYIYNTFDNSYPTSAKDPNRGAQHNALFVGRLEDQKNPLMLIRCAKAVLEQVPDFTLDIYGEGSLSDALKNEIEQSGLNDVVTLKGFCDDKAVYGKYDMLWLTSNFEGFGLVIIEAMSFATPTITTKWGEAVNEIVNNEKTGFIAENQEQFVEKAVGLMGNEPQLKTMRESCLHEFDHRFSTAQYKKRWNEIIQLLYQAE